MRWWGYVGAGLIIIPSLGGMAFVTWDTWRTVGPKVALLMTAVLVVIGSALVLLLTADLS